MYLRKTRRIKELEKQVADLIERTTHKRRRLSSEDLKKMREPKRA